MAKNTDLSSLDDKTKYLILQWVSEHRGLRPVWEKNPDKLEGYNVAMNHIENALVVREYI